MSKSSRVENAPWPDLTGRQIGEYFLLGKLGKGGLGTVYRVHQRHLDREFALKVLHLGAFASPDHVARFAREIRIIAQLDHPHIVRAGFAGVEDGLHYLVMELLDGATLNEIMLSHPRGLNIADACALVRDAANGLQYILKHSLIHRDIKPANLMLTRDARLKILDLGLARSTEDTGDILTGSNQVMGTPDFMAPEQCQQSQHLDIRSDLYSLGCTLYLLLTGHAPFGAFQFTTAISKMRAHVEVPPPNPHIHRGELPNELIAVVMRLLAKKPEERYQTPAEFLDAIEPFAVGADLSALIGTIPPVETTLNLPPALDRPGASLSTPSMRRRPSPKLPKHGAGPWIVIASALIAIAIRATMYLRFPATAESLAEEQSPPPTRTRMELPMGLEEDWKPGQMYHLLGLEPVAVRWPGQGAGINKSFDPQARTFLVFGDGLSLFELARVNKPDFDFGITMMRNEWNEPVGPGLYYGLKSNPNPQGEILGYLKCIHTTRDRNPMLNVQRFRLVRMSMSLSQPRRPGQQPGIPLAGELRAQAIPEILPKQNVTLKISVRNRVLISVQWNDQLMLDLSQPGGAERGEFPDATGGIGIVNRGSTNFSNAWLIVHPKE